MIDILNLYMLTLYLPSKNSKFFRHVNVGNTVVSPAITNKEVLFLFEFLVYKQGFEFLLGGVTNPIFISHCSIAARATPSKDISCLNPDKLQ